MSPGNWWSSISRFGLPAGRIPLFIGFGAILASSFTVTAESRPDLALGRQVYGDNCAICHGPKGDGRGEAAWHFATPPRDFTKGEYKLRSTDTGQLPTDRDLIRSIVQGMPSTAMVPQDHLSEAEVRAVVAYIKTLSPKFATVPTPEPIPIPPAPPLTPESIARGRRVYDKAECAECHGSGGRGDGPSASDLSVKPADLTRRPFKSGPTPRDIFRSILTGFDGTPMPAYFLTLEDEELWDLTYYVESLGSPPEVTEDERMGWHVERMHQRRR
jgi:mono/diheme cytochrome c family protein